jgi:ataxia telangiectasia mutated family protein
LDTFNLVGGLNLPKLIECVGSDGLKYKQLVKGTNYIPFSIFSQFLYIGKDDLRQDAVMQQMFSLVNTLLGEDLETRKRRLKIRTYKVTRYL